MITREPAVWERRGHALSGETQIVEPGEFPTDPFLELKYRIHQRLIEELDLNKLDSRDQGRARTSVEEAVGMMLVREGAPLARQERARLVVEIADEVLGLGPLESLIQDSNVTEVLVNRPNQIYIERNGILYLSNKLFRDETHIMRIIDKIIAPLGRHVDELSPMVDGRLPDGSRVNVIIPPLALDSPTISIRKFRKDVLSTDDLIKFGTFSLQVADLLRACVEGKVNIVVSGGTGTGKTTMLNVLSSYIPPNERVVTIEDPAELQLQQPHVVRLETRPSNIEGKGQVVQRDLVRNALRMRPDRILVGEVRSGEAFDMLQAMNTGHEGSLTTVHANSPRDSLARIENMVLMANLDLPIRAIREQISSAINLVIHLNRLTDGSRRIVQISEIAGTEGDIITMQDIYRFHYLRVDRDENKVIGELRATGLRPKVVDKLERLAITLPPGLFSSGEGERWTHRAS